MKKIDIEITPNLKGSRFIIDGVEIQGISKIKLEASADAISSTPEITLEFAGTRMNEKREIICFKTEDGDIVPEEFSHRITGYSVTVSISGEFNEYPLG